MLSQNLKLSRACLDEEDRKIGMYVVARSELVSTTKCTLLQAGNDVKEKCVGSLAIPQLASN